LDLKIHVCVCRIPSKSELGALENSDTGNWRDEFTPIPRSSRPALAMQWTLHQCGSAIALRDGDATAEM
jgi:hypothetical protein